MTIIKVEFRDKKPGEDIPSKILQVEKSKCYHRYHGVRLIVDTRTVICRECEEPLDPFDVLLWLSKDGSRLRNNFVKYAGAVEAYNEVLKQRMSKAERKFVTKTAEEKCDKEWNLE